MATRICFIRHGETDWNVAKRIQGQTDIPLNETGRAQTLAMAADVAEYEFGAIYSSDLSRALATAQLVAAPRGLEIRALPQLRERHFGILQGVTADEGKRRYPEAFARYQGRDPGYDFETGESLQNFAARIKAAVELMTVQHGGQTIAAICHAGVLDILYRRTTGRPLHTPRDFAIPNCALNWFRFETDAGETDGGETDGGAQQRWHLEAWGDHREPAVALPEAAE